MKSNWNCSDNSAGKGKQRLGGFFTAKFLNDQENREDPELLEDTPKDCLFDTYSQGRYLADGEAKPRRKSA